MHQAGRDLIALHHSWPLSEQPRQFELGHVLNCAVTDVIDPVQVGALGLHHAGCWECDLLDNSLIWSGGVYDIFGLPRGATVSRENVLALYTEPSRVAMERLRAHSIRHACGFTLDAEIQTAAGEVRSMRLITAPVCEAGQVRRLHGIKLII